MSDAPCAVDPEFWFPDAGASRIDIRDAKRVCATCPLRAACLQFALDNHILEGIWGGTTREERKAIWRKGKAA